MIKKYLGLSLITASMLVMGCSSDDDGPAATDGSTTGSMMDTLVTVPATVTFPDPLPADWVEPTLDIAALAGTVPELSSLLAAIGRTDLGTSLSDPAQTFTVFAPTNAAFDALPAGTVDDLTTEELTALLSNHVVVGALDGAGVGAGAGMSVAMLGGENQAIVNTDGALSIGGANISGTDTYATNGIVHLIDSVILLPAADLDTDGDTVIDTADNCPEVANTDQLDTDSNGVGDACEPDTTGTTDITDPVGAGEQAVIDAGNTEYIASFSPFFATQNMTDSAWTIFAPTNAAIGGATLTKAQIDNTIYTAGAPLMPADFVDGSTLSMFGGGEYAVTNDGTDITVGGFAVTQIHNGTAIIYSIDGVL